MGAMFAGLVCAAGMGAASGRAAGVDPWPLPAPAGSAQPGLEATADGLLFSWVEPTADGHRLRLARFDGTRFLDTTTVAEGARWFVNWADVPRVVALGGSRLAATVLVRNGPGATAYDVRLTRSEDGVSWSPLRTVHDDGTATEHGFVSLWAQGDSLGLAWLDGRLGAGSNHDGHQHGTAPMTLRSAHFVGDQRMSEAQIDARTCDCCQTDVALAGTVPILVYRDRTQDEVRDIAVTRWRNGAWTEPAPVHRDGWVMPGCPVNGPAIAARGDEVVVAWFTAEGEHPRVLMARSRDAGVSFSAPVVVAAGEVSGRVDIALDEHGPQVLWVGETASQQTLWLTRYADAREAEPQVLALAEPGRGRGTGFARLQLHAGRSWVVWTDVTQGRPQVRGASVDFRAALRSDR